MSDVVCYYRGWRKGQGCNLECVEVCPVDCIHGPHDPMGCVEETKAPNFDPQTKRLYINPDECIDCGACEPECPFDAIVDNDHSFAEREIKIARDFFSLIEDLNHSSKKKKIIHKLKYINKKLLKKIQRVENKNADAIEKMRLNKFKKLSRYAKKIKKLQKK